LLLVPIFTNTKLEVHIWNQGKQSSRLAIQVDNFLRHNEPTPNSLESAPMWTLEQFTITLSTWGFYLLGLGSTPWIGYCQTTTPQTPSTCCSF
jgi:hypothetical protein